MRGLTSGCVVALAVAVLATAATAADVSDQTLTAMGLGNMAKMSDAQGMEVRGLGYVAAWGGASSNLGYGNRAHAGYVAAGNYVAVGGALTKVYSECLVPGSNTL